jgi:hypothetical protein
MTGAPICHSKGGYRSFFPYLNPQPESLTLQLTLEDAAGRLLALDPSGAKATE